MSRRRTWLLPAAAIGLLGFTAVSGACGDDDDGAPAEVQLTMADNGATVAVARHGAVVVALSSNASTGYSWSVVAEEPAHLELEGEPRYVPPGSTAPAVGAAGTQVFTFRAIATGSAKLSMAYARTFEPGGAPAETFEVTVTVE